MKEKRMYGLFEKKDGKWVRLYPELSMVKSAAIKVFQNALLAYAMQDMPERTLRPLNPQPVKDDYPIQEDKCGNRY